MPIFRENASISGRERRSRTSLSLSLPGPLCQVKARLPELVEAGFLDKGRKYGIGQWALTAKARKRLGEVPEVTRSLPESPRHRRWRDARDAAEQDVEGFYLSLRDSVDATADLLSMPMPPGPSSDAWFEAGERLHRACRRLGSATRCLPEWGRASRGSGGP